MTKQKLVESVRTKVNQDGKEIHQLMQGLLKDNRKSVTQAFPLPTITSDVLDISDHAQNSLSNDSQAKLKRLAKLVKEVTDIQDTYDYPNHEVTFAIEENKESLGTAKGASASLEIALSELSLIWYNNEGICTQVGAYDAHNYLSLNHERTFEEETELTRRQKEQEDKKQQLEVAKENLDKIIKNKGVDFTDLTPKLYKKYESSSYHSSFTTDGTLFLEINGAHKALLGLVMKIREDHKNPNDYKFTCFSGDVKNATKEIPYMHNATYVFAQLKKAAHEI